MAHPGPDGQQREEACQEHEKQCVNILQEQYTSVFSNPENPDKKLPPNTSECSISDIQFTRADIEAAIDEIRSDSGSTDIDIPATLLKY